MATLENRTRAVAGLGSDSMAVDCCGGAPSAGCGVDSRTTGTVRTDFGNTAESCEIELVGVARTDFGNTAKSCAIEFAGVNKSPFCAASFGCGGVWVPGMISS